MRRGDFLDDGKHLAGTDFLQMAEYRVYEIGDGDHIVKVTPLVCQDDREAIERASELAEGARHRGLER